MAEQSPIGNKQVSDHLKQKRQMSATSPKTRRKVVTGRGAIQRVTKDEAPPARGLIRKEAKSDPTGKPMRRLKKRPPGTPGLKRKVPGQAADASKPEVRIVTKTLPDGTVVKKRMVRKKVLKKKKMKELTPEEQEQLRLETEQREKEEAEKRAEEERIMKEKHAEEERLRLEKEAEEKRLEEERIRLEKEAELKRVEEERIRRENERQRILTKIEFCKGALSPEDQTKANKIAEEMVSRNIKWDGYISLSSGIGGSMIK